MDDLRTPGHSVCTYGFDEGWDAVDHAIDRGDAVVLSLCPDHTVAAYYAPDRLTVLISAEK